MFWTAIVRRFSANLLFGKRFAAAAELGVVGVEYIGAYDMLLSSFKSFVTDNELEQVLFSLPLGNGCGGANLNLSGGISFTDDTLAIQAAIAGRGIVLASREMVVAELKSGLLVQPFGPELKGYGYHLCRAIIRLKLRHLATGSGQRLNRRQRRYVR